MPINRWMDKDNMVHIYNGILLIYKKEWNCAICRDVDGPRDCQSKVSQKEKNKYCISSVQSLSCIQLSMTPWTAARHASLSITSSGVHPNPCPSCRWCHPAISSSVITFSSCPQSFPASGAFQTGQLSASGGESIGVSALTSVPPMNTHDWSPLGWTGWISLQSKELSRVFSNTTVQKHQFFSAQLSSQSNSYIHTWRLEKP